MKVLFLLLIVFISCGKQPEEINPINNTIDMEAAPVEDGSTDTDTDTDGVTTTSNSFTGEDYQGNTRTCENKFGTVNCTAMFTDSDAFANNCVSNGDKAVMCACHDWICVSQ